MVGVNLKFLKSNLLACLQEVTSSLRLFKVATSGLQMMNYFSQRYKLHRPEIDPLLTIFVTIFSLGYFI